MDNELHPADNFEQTGEWPDPTPEMLDTILFDTIWRTIKSWDVNVPHAYSGYMGATGNHARAIYDAVLPLIASTPSRNDVLEEAEGWVVGNGDETRWRSWNDSGPCWVSDLTKAIRYYRREDAELAHGCDEDAWLVLSYSAAIRARKDQTDG